MSKLKNPQDKKRLSLENDRRNAYGENGKSSRKNIPKSKQISHQATRLAANQPLRQLGGSVTEDEAVAAELQSHGNSLKKGRAAFRKFADASLRAVLFKKQTGHWPAGRA
jgi:hypothetical protein